MAKTQKPNPNNRPMIIVSVSTTKWEVDRNLDTEEPILVNKSKSPSKADEKISCYQIVRPKEETMTTGKFTVQFREGWHTFAILKDGTAKQPWICRNEHIDFSMNSIEECLEAIRLSGKKIANHDFEIYRERQSYFNPKTKKVTTDKKVAEGWFKGKNPLFVSSSQWQRIGMWIEPAGEDCVDVTIWYNNRIQRENSQKWMKATETGFRLYNDSTISHFYRGKFCEPKRKFETERLKYRTLDVRFRGQYRLSTLMADLRAPELIGADGECNGLCEESKKILKDAGFPEKYWCWNNSSRPFNDTYDLINFITHIQHREQTKIGVTLDEFLADKPFSITGKNVLQFNKGILIRVPGYREEWESEGRQFDHKPSPWEGVSIDKAKLVKAIAYEKYRVWISNDGKKRTCQEQIHYGTCWKSTRWDSVSFTDSITEDYYIEKVETPEEKAMQHEAITKLNEALKTLYVSIFVDFPLLARFKDFAKRHPELKRGSGLKRLLDALFEAPKMTETLIKIGYEDWFFHQSKDGCYCLHYDKEFSLRKLKDRFGLRDNFKEKSSWSLYKNLGVTKEQFTWLASLSGDDACSFMRFFREINILIPGKHNEYYHGFETIPTKYLKIINDSVKEIVAHLPSQYGHEPQYYDGANKIQRLIHDYSFSPIDIEKCLKRDLPLDLLVDYLRMRLQCTNLEGFDASHWDKIPSDVTDLRFSHDRLLEFYNLMQAERERYYRAQEEQRLIKCQENYDVRYKKLQKLAYQEDDDTRIVVVPKKLVELVTEGQVLHHCVGSFATSVSEGKDTIVFLRNKETPNTPYATISLLQHGDKWVVDQAHTAHNGPITSADVDFLRRWAKKNNVDANTVQQNYGAHCHH